MAHKNLATLSAAGLERFMRRWNLTRNQAGKELGVSQRMIYWYLNGKHAIPQTIGTLVKALDENWSRQQR